VFPNPATLASVLITTASNSGGHGEERRWRRPPRPLRPQVDDPRGWSTPTSSNSRPSGALGAQAGQVGIGPVHGDPEAKRQFPVFPGCHEWHQMSSIRVGDETTNAIQ
jgi:hypothetical protein